MWGSLPSQTVLRGEFTQLEDLVDSVAAQREPVQVETYMDADFNVTHKATAKHAKKGINKNLGLFMNRHWFHTLHLTFIRK